MCRTVGPSFVASPECVAHHRNVEVISIGMTLVDVHLN